MTLALTIYALCAITSFACSVLLFRSYARSKVRLLLWSGLCFAFFTLNNVLLFIDAKVPDVDLSAARTLPTLIGLLLLIYGLVWETE